MSPTARRPQLQTICPCGGVAWIEDGRVVTSPDTVDAAYAPVPSEAEYVVHGKDGCEALNSFGHLTAARGPGGEWEIA